MGRGSRNQATSSATSLLYGRRPRRGSGPAATPLPSKSRPEGVLSDQDMFDHSGEFTFIHGRLPRSSEGVYLLAETPKLTAAPTAKEYSGGVGIVEESDGSQSFVGWTNYGPAGRGLSQGKVEYRGPDFDGAISAVNLKLSKKQSVNARSVYSAPGGPHFLSRQAVTLP